ncbi:unnamed protein product [Effrenium voratum]|nr:unnamed protein product [Effrenium voratum]
MFCEKCTVVDLIGSHFNHALQNDTTTPRCWLGETEGTVVAVTHNVTTCSFHGGPVRIRPDRTAADTRALGGGLFGVSISGPVLKDPAAPAPPVLVFVNDPPVINEVMPTLMYQEQGRRLYVYGAHFPREPGGDCVFFADANTSGWSVANICLCPERCSKAWEHFALVNQLRAEGYTCPNGASYAPNPTPLNFDCRLWRASRLHSEDMASQNYFSHTSLDGRSPWDRAEEQGISANGENIAAGRSSASGALEQWKNSDGHCKNMMSSKHHVFAVGYAYDSSARYKHYWTQMLKHSDVSDLDTSCYPATATISTTSETTTMTSSTSATTMSTTTTSSDTSTTGSATQSSTSATTSSITETSSETSMTATQTTEAQVQGENTSQGTVTSTAATGTSVTSVASSTSLQVTTAEVARSDMTTTTTTLASVTGKLLLQVSDSEAFLAAASRLQGLRKLGPGCVSLC